ncbi:N-carbamyl-L-amino acid amidohydrolase [Colwellia sp. MT41]|uniref:Negative modulator of initiation of replication n=1 Tax=Colwellia marinimaniae TaxID=1513592 RepID=A0ABQ0MXI4_9GAMM|nr:MULTISPECIES: replication initiation negative regulator SeqA [Colwellia]ALO34347.1 N-carbamyl-L-amino acid amidohydrolase [Colwellia sp. MT41]GAW96371.1 negative modulator of initiation of replication [Colwellia marinimaniae]
MKNIEIDEELYQYIATNTQYIGESASAILRRLLKLDLANDVAAVTVNEISAEIEVKVAIDSEKPVVHVNTAVVKEPEAIKRVKVLPDSHETVFNFINKEELAMQRGAVGRFLLILAALYRAHPQQFGVVTEISGRDRLYFANSENKLAESGSSTKPRQIPESPFWVITNSNTTRKKMMLTKASISLGYSDLDVEKIRELL